MRIAYLVNQYPMVSHVFIRREILALERRGVEITRIALRGWDSEVVDEEDHLERKRTRYVLRGGVWALLLGVARLLATKPVRLLQALGLALHMGRRAERPLLVHLVYLAEACRIEPWLRADGVDHVHVHFGTNAAEVAMLVRALGGPPWSFTVHGPKEYDNVSPMRLADKIRHCAFVVAITSYGRSQLYRLVEHRHWSKVKVVHCGLEVSLFASITSAASTARRLVCVGRICEQKGQLLLVEAAHELSLRGIDFELVLVGDGEMRAEIEALIKRNELQDKVRITGRVSSEQLHNEILSARALVLPSFAEGLPMVIMEAMALSRPVISTFVAGIPELVHPREHGWLVPAGDVGELSQAMQDCLDTEADALALMGEAARQRVFARHDVDVQAEQLAKLFQNSIEAEEHRVLAVGRHIESR
jgi:glycosyltransferase involved in cell wall biosynthesis